MLTGSTGVMGSAGLKELLLRNDRFDLTLLVRKSWKNRRLMAKYASAENIRIVWGDLLNYEDVLAAVDGADYVLHVGGMVSPLADRYPAETLKVNITAAENIVRAVKAQPDPDRIKVVYIGSVAQTGDRRAPVHWGRTGDPICPSIYDYYAVSKCTAERIIAESGLKYWVSLRQSGILYPGIMKKVDPIMFHIPNQGVLEWATVEDSGVLLANVCEDDVPESFWNRFYNIGSGEQYRLTNYEFEKAMMKCMSCPPPDKVFKAEWFALRNFHGQWYLDSDLLDDILHFRRNIPLAEYLAGLRRHQPWYYALTPMVPAFVMRAFMRLLAHDRRRRPDELDPEQRPETCSRILRVHGGVAKLPVMGGNRKCPSFRPGRGRCARPRLRRIEAFVRARHRRHAQSRRIPRWKMSFHANGAWRHAYAARMGVPMRTPFQGHAHTGAARRALVSGMCPDAMELRRRSPAQPLLCTNLGAAAQARRKQSLRRTGRRRIKIYRL